MKDKEKKFIKRIRKPDNNFYKFLRLNRAEFGHTFNSKNKISDNLGYYPNLNIFINLLAKKLKVKTNNLLIGLGAESIIKDVLYYFSENKKNLGFLTPNYFMYNIYSKLYNYRIFNLGINPENPNGLNIKKLKEFIYKKKIKIFVLVNPSHPFEKNWTIVEIKDLLLFCKRNNVILIIDEVYQELGSKSAKHLIQKFNNLIIVSSFSKNLGLPGLRVGYMMSSKNIIEKIESFRLAIELPFHSIKIATEYLENKNKNKKIRNQIIKARNYAHKEFKKRNIAAFGKFGNTVTFKVKSKSEAQKIGNYLKNKKILINFNYQKPFDNFLNLTTTNVSNLKIFFSKLDSISKN
jgi:histidinol-phosphate aminotransferase